VISRKVNAVHELANSRLSEALGKIETLERTVGGLRERLDPQTAIREG
jgi:hypothetical protein